MAQHQSCDRDSIPAGVQHAQVLTHMDIKLLVAAAILQVGLHFLACLPSSVGLHAGEEPSFPQPASPSHSPVRVVITPTQSGARLTLLAVPSSQEPRPAVLQQPQRSNAAATEAEQPSHGPAAASAEVVSQSTAAAESAQPVKGAEAPNGWPAPCAQHAEVHEVVSVLPAGQGEGVSAQAVPLAAGKLHVGDALALAGVLAKADQAAKSLDNNQAVVSDKEGTGTADDLLAICTVCLLVACLRCKLPAGFQLLQWSCC